MKAPETMPRAQSHRSLGGISGRTRLIIALLPKSSKTKTTGIINPAFKVKVKLATMAKRTRRPIAVMFAKTNRPAITKKLVGLSLIAFRRFHSFFLIDFRFTLTGLSKKPEVPWVCSETGISTAACKAGVAERVSINVKIQIDATEEELKYSCFKCIKG
ncbi:MAG: hypothetical protein KI786_19600 [Mameliella sp.]|nr:hypothetical protein [Phaeodactylibacter sp.]